MDVVKLRKLAEKSIWDYGKFKGYTVRDIMLCHKKYIVWAYYNLEKISFVDDILDDLHKTFGDKFKRIDKPGKEPEYYEEKFTFDLNNLSKEKLFNMITANRLNGKPTSRALFDAYSKAKQRCKHSQRDEYLSKSSLQAINHGRSYDIEVRVAPTKKK